MPLSIWAWAGRTAVLAAAGYFLFYSSSVIAEEGAKQSKSHFVQVFVSSMPLPRGAKFSQVSEFLTKKMALRSDLAGQEAATKEEIDSGCAVKDIAQNNPILAAEVTDGIPPAMRDVVPPRKKLTTVLLSKSAAADVVLCTPYDRLVITLTHTGAKGQTVQGTLAGFRLNEPPLPSLLVIALEPSSVLLIEGKKQDELSVKCARENKYE